MSRRPPLSAAEVARVCAELRGEDGDGEMLGVIMLASSHEKLRAIADGLQSELHDRRAKVAELRALFQQTYGVHVSWVRAGADADKLRARVAELEAQNVAIVERCVRVETELDVLQNVKP